MLFILSKNKQFQALFFIIITFIFNPLLYANDQIFLLDNGMEVILKENHNSPMVASMVFVKSGSKYESQYENGITHFLEHLLFNGTVHQSREDIEGSIRNLGGYINAFTRKELTAYLVLLPRQYIDFGMTVQVDMLFNSIIPEEELSKERKVVIEEINRDTDSPGSQAEKFFTAKAYTGTPYNRPVLGYKAFINNIPRKAIIDYWKRFYRPDNMILLVIGDFESNEMQQTIESTFGSIKIVDSLAEKKSHLDLSEQAVLKINISGQKVYDTVANVKSTYINFSLNAPHYSDPDYIAFDLLSQYLDMDEISPLMIALKGGLNPLATEASVSLVTYEEFSRLEVSVVTDKPENSQKIVSIITEQMKSVSNSIADNETISGIKTSVKCQDIYISEKLHYLGFMIAPMLMTAGWEFTQDYPEKLEKVMWSDCQKAAQNWLSNPNYIATIVKPIRDSIQIPYSPKEMTPENVAAYFDTTDFQEYNLDTGYSLTFPTTDSVSFDMVDNAEYHREILKNGMTVIIKSRPDSRVFAMNVIGKNRSANEPDDKAGITDFVNRCIAKSTVTRNASELSRDLAKIGANVTLYDNPWIPYDDHYTSQRFSFMKFETIDEFAEKGFHLFTEMILDPAFDSAEVENIRQSMLGVLH
ncbi:MAG: insulinase family protein, partial [Candidatus Zixiibacteriota bacterium]